MCTLYSLWFWLENHSMFRGFNKICSKEAAGLKRGTNGIKKV